MRLSLQFLDLERDAPEKPPCRLDGRSRSPRPAAGDARPRSLATSLTSTTAPPDRPRRERRPSCSPTRSASRPTSVAADDTDPRDRSRSSPTRAGPSPLWLDAVAVRAGSRCCGCPFDDVQGGGQGARRLAQHGVRHRGRRRRPAATTAPAGRARRRAAGLDGDQHPHEASRAPTPSPWPGMLVPTGEMPDRRALQAHPGGDRRAPAASGDGEPRRPRREWTAALPTSLVVRIARQQTADRRLRHVQRAGRRRSRCTSPGAQVLTRTTRSARLGGIAFNLTLLSYDGSLDMGLHIDAAAVTDPVLLRNLMEDSFAELVEAGQPPRANQRETAERRSRRRGREEGQLTDAGTGSGSGSAACARRAGDRRLQRWTRAHGRPSRAGRDR